jgi:UDP-galactopyranose mutase
MDKFDFLIVGAGFAGSVLAERIASKLNRKVLIVEKRDHIGGNCYDYRDTNGILVQKYGPHIFHTNSKPVFNYLSRFTGWHNYRHKVVGLYRNNYYPIPINLDTVNLFYGLRLKNARELKKFLEKKRVKLDHIANSKDVVVARFGEELYEAFIKHYTKKQWGRYPEELDKSVLERLICRYDHNPYYFADTYQGLPASGYTKMFEHMLDDKNIQTRLNTDFFKLNNSVKYDRLIYTGRLDQFFNYRLGHLDYRGIHFAFEKFDRKSYQPHCVVNHPEMDVEYSRVTEFKKLYNTISSSNTVICKEYFNWDGEPCYPVLDWKNSALLKRYCQKISHLKNVIFLGRLACFKYLNMDQVVEDSLDAFETIIYPDYRDLRNIRKYA